MKTIQAGALLLTLVGTLNAQSFMPLRRWLQDAEAAPIVDDTVAVNATGSGEPANPDLADGVLTTQDSNADNQVDPDVVSGNQDDVPVEGEQEQSSVDSGTCPAFDLILSNQNATLDDLAAFPCQLFFKYSDLGEITNLSSSIISMTQQLALQDVGIIDFDSPIQANATVAIDDSLEGEDVQDVAQSVESQFADYVSQYSPEFRFYLLENQNVLLRKYMTELLKQQNDMMKYVDGIYKNQQYMLYWLNDHESRLNQNLTNATIPDAQNITVGDEAAPGDSDIQAPIDEGVPLEQDNAAGTSEAAPVDSEAAPADGSGSN